MADRKIIYGATELNPMFFIPDGVYELVHEDEFTDASTREIEDEVEVEDDDEDENVPKILSITQKLRRVKGGAYVVDVTVTVSDIEGATDYGFKRTKL